MTKELVESIAGIVGLVSIGYLITLIGLGLLKAIQISKRKKNDPT